MKKLFALLLAGVMAFSMAACSNEKEKTPAGEMPADMAAMTAPIDALARCMLENDLTYDAQDPEFFWIALYYFTGAYGLDHSMITQMEGSYQLQIPTPVMEEHASALFADYDDLFDLPSIMKGNVSYDPDVDAYFTSRGDIGLSEMKLSNFAETETGYTLLAELYSTDETADLIAAWDVTLADNAYADGIETPLYLYSVASMTQIQEDSMDDPDNETTADDPAPTSTETTTAIFNGLADSHTVELTLPYGSVQPFQFDADSDAAKVLGSLMEGDGLTIHYTETKNGSLMIVSIE